MESYSYGNKFLSIRDICVYSLNYNSEIVSILIGFFGVATLTVLLIFLHNIISLTLHAGNPRERQGEIKGMLMYGLAVAGLGAITIWLGFLRL